MIRVMDNINMNIYQNDPNNAGTYWYFQTCTIISQTYVIITVCYL